MSIELQQLRAGDSFAGRYRVIRLIRAGGMGAVYEVEDVSTRRRRALKIMHPSLLQSADSQARFQREVFIGAELETEHVVEVIDAGVDQASGVPYLTMELLRGEELGDRLGRTGRIEAQEAIGILVQVARALDKAHSRGIVHRDLKPENVFLTQREDGSTHAKILDFGIAKLLAGAQTSATQTAGTPLFMAPEQTDKMGRVSAATDVWALGLLAYRLIVGRSYWQGDSLQQLYRQILMDPITSAVERAAAASVQLPAGFDGWFVRCVTRRPEDRFQSAGVAIFELGKLFGLSMSRPNAFAPVSRSSFDQTAPPVANLTPSFPSPSQPPAADRVSNSPVPANASFPAAALRSSPGITPYPSPQITPHPGSPPFAPPYGYAPGVPVATPNDLVVQRTSVSGTQLAPPQGDLRASSPSANPAAPAARGAPSSSGSGVAIGVAVAIVALGIGGGIFAFTRGKTTAATTTTPSSDAPRARASKAPPSAASSDTSKVDPNAWVQLLVSKNPFVQVGTKAFALQQHEVTREEYSLFLDDVKGARKPIKDADLLDRPLKEGKVPMTWVTWEAADAYCQAIGARLPTADEWQAAVAGDDGRKYPWGNAWPAHGSDDWKHLAADRSDAVPTEVATSSLDTGPYGHFDLAGNVQEWTSTDAPSGKHKLLRGTDVSGDAKEYDAPGELFTEKGAPTDAKPEFSEASEEVGFRCAK